MCNLRGCPHAHICVFLHEQDRISDDPDKIDQMIWAEIPVEYNSKEGEEFLKKYRKSDDHRYQRWKDLVEKENEGKQVRIWFYFIINNVFVHLIFC